MLQLLLPGHVFALSLSVLNPLQDLQHGRRRVQEGLGLLLLLQLSTLKRQRTFVVGLGVSGGLKSTGNEDTAQHSTFNSEMPV